MLTLCVLASMVVLTGCILLLTRYVVGYMQAATSSVIEKAGDVNVMVMQETANAMRRAYEGPQHVDNGGNPVIETEAVGLTAQPPWMAWGDPGEDMGFDPLDGVEPDTIDPNSGRIANVRPGGIPNFPPGDMSAENIP